MREKKEPERDSDIVYIYEENCLGKIISHGAYASLVRYFKDGIEYDIDMLNEEFEILQEFGIGYIKEEDL